MTPIRRRACHGAGFCLLAFVVASVGCLNRPSSQPCVTRGPEAQDLVAQTRGIIFLDRPVGGVVAYTLPSIEEWMVRAPGPTPILAMSNTAEDGSMLLVQQKEAASDELNLVRYDICGHREESLESWRSTDAARSVLDGGLGLSADGSLIALVVEPTDVELRNPDALLVAGSLVVWNQATGTRKGLADRVLQKTVAWQDQTHLVITRLKLRAAIAALDIDKEFLADVPGWDEVPVVTIINIESGHEREVAVGYRPVLAPSTSEILFASPTGSWRRTESSTMRAEPVNLPGSAGGAIGLIGTSLVLYWACPTDGSPIGYTVNNSPLVGRKQLVSINVTDIRTGKFQTVLPAVDPRRTVCFVGDVPRGLPCRR